MNGWRVHVERVLTGTLPYVDDCGQVGDRFIESRLMVTAPASARGAVFSGRVDRGYWSHDDDRAWLIVETEIGAFEVLIDDEMDDVLAGLDAWAQFVRGA